MQKIYFATEFHDLFAEISEGQPDHKRVSALGEPSMQTRQVDYNGTKHGRGVLLPLISFPCAPLPILKTQGEARRAGVGSSFAPDVTLKFSV